MNIDVIEATERKKRFLINGMMKVRRSLRVMIHIEHKSKMKETTIAHKLQYVVF